MRIEAQEMSYSRVHQRKLRHKYGIHRDPVSQPQDLCLLDVLFLYVLAVYTLLMEQLAESH